MQNSNNLNTSINTLNAGEAAALADINRRTTLANDSYNSGLASANAKIEADYINNLLSQREKELNRQLQERQFNESVRQFNENMKFQREQLQSRFSSGSGGGGSTRYYSSRANNNQTNNQTNNAKTGRDAVKVGQLYAVDTGTKTIWYQKQANGKDTVVASPYAPITAKAKTTTSKNTTKKTATKKTTTKKSNTFSTKKF